LIDKYFFISEFSESIISANLFIDGSMKSIKFVKKNYDKINQQELIGVWKKSEAISINNRRVPEDIYISDAFSLNLLYKNPYALEDCLWSLNNSGNFMIIDNLSGNKNEVYRIDKIDKDTLVLEFSFLDLEKEIITYIKVADEV
jgi:hypothetical protein